MYTLIFFFIFTANWLNTGNLKQINIEDASKIFLRIEDGAGIS
jgi:hypothetical protein